MTQDRDNAFIRAANEGSSRSTPWATLRATLRTEVESDAPGADPMWEVAPVRCAVLGLSPMRLVDAIAVWRGSGSSEDARTIVIDARLSAGGGRTAAPSLAEVCRAAVGDEADIVEAECVVVGDDALERLVRAERFDSLTLVRVDGPVEATDVAAIRAALAQGRHAWAGDLRAVALLQVADDRSMLLATTEPELPAAMVAENLRHYLAARLDREVSTIGACDPGLVAPILEGAGTFTVRPVETDVYSTFVDLGICTSASEDEPARIGLIYDIASATWHGE